MTNRLLVPLLVLCSFVPVGTQGPVREVAEQEIPVHLPSQVLAAAHPAPRRTESRQRPGRRSPAALCFSYARQHDRTAAPVAPHGRPDNTRGDPACC
jgi:hypothetical protein